MNRHLNRCLLDTNCWFPLKTIDYPFVVYIWHILLRQIYFWVGIIIIILKIVFSKVVNTTRTKKIIKKISLKKSSGASYFITFYSTVGHIHGHGFIAWGNEQCTHENFSGFYPSSKFRGHTSVFVKAKGKILYEEDKKYINDVIYALQVEVDLETYNYAKHITCLWQESFYAGGKRDCVTYLYSVAQHIGLKTPVRGFFYLYTIPETYLPKLIKMNS
ncbi:hypothetical protein [Candidatus Uabimicrobium sp. HlEnr_7]|uniref:hypothetical protein n=1 Tax=Candidatus Uabimicrobium helgolandensis TaxID=3095367 RepID=UPI003557660B